MKKAKVIFRVFSTLFLPLYSLMILLYFEQITEEEDPLALLLDQGMIGLGFVFMTMQVFMQAFVGKVDEGVIGPTRRALLRRTFPVGLVIWFTLEVVLGYWWCLVTGANPLTAHTPFVVMFLGFNVAQFWSLKTLGVFGSAGESELVGREGSDGIP